MGKDMNVGGPTGHQGTHRHPSTDASTDASKVGGKVAAWQKKYPLEAFSHKEGPVEVITTYLEKDHTVEIKRATKSDKKIVALFADSIEDSLPALQQIHRTGTRK